MKIAYFDCPTGISGNMILGAMLDSGLSLGRLKKELKKTGLRGYDLIVKKMNKRGFPATHLDVAIKDTHARRAINDIYRLISISRLRKGIKTNALAIFKRLYAAEAKVHGKRTVHLHEVGAIDAIVDVVGACIGMKELGITEVYCSPLPVGYGPIKHRHGSLPNPAPAAAELLKQAVIYKKNIKSELVTPTGAAIITHFAKSFKDMPRLELKKVGLGAGTFDLNEANILRLFIGESQPSYDEDLVLEIQTNIDNMNPELYDHVIKELMKEGALDAYITQVRMKKGRPGVTLTALSDVKDKDKMTKIIFDETTTLGVRTYLVKREKLARRTLKVMTRYGGVKVKAGSHEGMVKNLSPEYSDCLKLSKKAGVPLKLVCDAARSAALRDILQD